MAGYSFMGFFVDPERFIGNAFPQICLSTLSSSNHITPIVDANKVFN